MPRKPSLKQLIANADKNERRRAKYRLGTKPWKEKDLEGLPVPRLEIRWERIDREHALATYRMVYQHYVDGPMAVIMGRTKVDGSIQGIDDYFWYLGEPFRDSHHIRHDMKQLNLRGFVIAGDKYREITSEKRVCDNAEELQKKRIEELLKFSAKGVEELDKQLKRTFK